MDEHHISQSRQSLVALAGPQQQGWLVSQLLDIGVAAGAVAAYLTAA